MLKRITSKSDRLPEQDRRKFIGASEIYRAVSQPATFWLSKHTPSKNNATSIFASLGNDLEQYVLDSYSELSGIQFIPNFRQKEFSFDIIRCHLDTAYMDSDNIVPVDAKLRIKWKKKEWDNEVPFDAYAQIQTQCHLLNLSGHSSLFGELCVYFVDWGILTPLEGQDIFGYMDSLDYKIYTVKYDEYFCVELFESAIKLFNKKTPPDLDMDNMNLDEARKIAVYYNEKGECQNESVDVPRLLSENIMAMYSEVEYKKDLLRASQAELKQATAQLECLMNEGRTNCAVLSDSVGNVQYRRKVKKKRVATYKDVEPPQFYITSKFE